MASTSGVMVCSVGAVVEYFLRLLNTADHRTDDALPLQQQVKSRDRRGLWRSANTDHHAISIESVQVFGVIMRGRYGVDDEIKMIIEAVHPFIVLRQSKIIPAHAPPLLFFCWRNPFASTSPPQ